MRDVLERLATVAAFLALCVCTWVGAVAITAHVLRWLT